MQLLDQIIQAATNNPAQLVVPEATDPRVLKAAYQAHQKKIAKMTLIGSAEAIQQTASEVGISINSMHIEDPNNTPHFNALAEAFTAKRAHRGMTLEKANKDLLDPLLFANMLVNNDLADGVVSGAVYSTADVVRAALQIIGKEPNTDIVSSFFLMLLDQAHHPCQRAVIFADCGLVIDPNEKELAAIAIAAAHSAKTLLNEAPKIAMLSFSTDGSAQHPAVTKVKQAAKLVKKALPNVAIDEDVQFDAAIIPEIASRKLKHSKVQGQANVFIFPNLDAGNIGYKIAERLGGATAIGPLLQGLKKPANDLSRGCDTNDVFNALAITSLQAQQSKK